MKKIFSLVLLFFFHFFSCQNLDLFYHFTQDYNVHSSSGTTNNVCSIAIDSQENMYMVGYYQENLGVDMTKPTVFQLVSPIGSSNQCYIVKIDKNNKYLWHKTISTGTSSVAYIYSITIDKNDDVIIAGGATGNSINLNPDSASSPIYSTDNFLQGSIFLNKYSKNGDFVFGNFYKGGIGIPKVTLDKNENIFLTGQYSNYFAGHNTDFDLSSQTFYLAGSQGSAFILKNDINGNFISAKFLQGAQINSIKFDNNDDLVILGNGGNINFNNEKNYTNPTSSSFDGNFLLKIDSNITPIWFQSIGGRDIYSFQYDSQPFDIDTDNSIIVSTSRVPTTINFPNQSIQITDPLARGVLYKLDSAGNYKWHSILQQSNNSQTLYPISVSIASDHTINWTNKLYGVYNFDAVGEPREQISCGFGYIYYGEFRDYGSLLKLNQNGKLIYNKHKIIDHSISRNNRKNNKMYFAGAASAMDPNPDMTINGGIPNIPGTQFGAHIQRLDKCYSGTPDGDPHLYACSSELKKLSYLFPKTSYSTWYDSPTSTTPLSPETILEDKKYYASTQDVSCPFNPKRLEVDVRIFQNPSDLTVNDFTFCNVGIKQIRDLNINNNKDVQFFNSNMQEIYLTTYLLPNKRYYVRQVKEHTYPYWVTCRSNLTSFFVYDISTPPAASAIQNFCKIDNKKISDIVVTATNPKWYQADGTEITDLSTLLIDNQKYFVSQTSSSCQSAKTEILIKLSDPNPPNGNTTQTFCSTLYPTFKNIVVTGTDIKWYNNLGTQIPETTLLQDGLTYFASQKIGSCESTSKLAVKVNVLANYLAATDYNHPAFCNDSTANIKTENLDKYKRELIPNPQDYTFLITDSKGQTINGDANLNIGQNIFDVKIISGLGCFQSVKLSLTLNEKPKINLPAELEFCNNAGVPLDAGYGKDYIYEWNTGETSQIINADKEQTYTVKVTTKQGCENSASIFVKKAKLAEIQNILINNSNNASVIMSFADDYLYSLDKIKWQSSNKFENLKNGNYTVYVKTNLGCDLGSKSFTIFSLSNIFSPNNDGINDTWEISGLEQYPNSQIRIIDKNGRMVLDTITKGEAFEWNGEYNGRKLPTDNYWYQIKLSDGRMLEGYVVIKNR